MHLAEHSDEHAARAAEEDLLFGQVFDLQNANTHRARFTQQNTTQQKHAGYICQHEHDDEVERHAEKVHHGGANLLRHVSACVCMSVCVCVCCCCSV